MKKVVCLMAFALGLYVSKLQAACMGPFCYDDQGASVAGLIVNGNGSAMPVMSSTTIVGITPRAVGQEIMCNTCVNGGSGNFGVCVDTAAVKGAWVMISSTTQKCQ